jgi:hypothetical protein
MAEQGEVILETARGYCGAGAIQLRNTSGQLANDPDLDRGCLRATLESPEYGLPSTGLAREHPEVVPGVIGRGRLTPALHPATVWTADIQDVLRYVYSTWRRRPDATAQSRALFAMSAFAR